MSVGNCICTFVSVCILCMCSLYLIPAYSHCVASAAKRNKTPAGLLCNVELRREAATTRLLEAASACSTAGGETRTFGAYRSIVLGADYMDAWAALCTALGHVLRIRIVCSFGPTAGCARHPENLGGHTAIAFHPSSDWMRRLATSEFTGECNSRMPPVVAVVVVVVVFLLPSCPSSKTRAVDVSPVSDQLTYPGRRSLIQLST